MSYIIRELQIKHQWDTITYLLKRQKYKKSVSHAGLGGEQHKLSFIAGENVKQYSHFRRQFGSFTQN